MTPADFPSAFESELHFRAIAFSGAHLQEFVAPAGPLIEEHPDAAFGAGS